MCGGADETHRCLDAEFVALHVTLSMGDEPIGTMHPYVVGGRRRVERDRTICIDSRGDINVLDGDFLVAVQRGKSERDSCCASVAQHEMDSLRPEGEIGKRLIRERSCRRVTRFL